MKKKTLFTVLLIMSSFLGSLQAQNSKFVQTSDSLSQSSQVLIRFGTINSNDLLAMMPEKVDASNAIRDLNQKYKNELMLMQNDYDKKYSDYMTFQSVLSQNIKLRRMQELQDLEHKINDFMKVAQEDVQAQEQQLIAPLRQKLKATIAAVGVERNLVCIYDLSSPSVAFVTPNAEDVTPYVKAKLGIK